MPSELSLRAQGRESLPVPNLTSGGRGRRLAAQAGEEAFASDLNTVVARRELANLELFFNERLHTDGRVAANAARLARDEPTAAPMLADSCTQYQEAANSIGRRRFLPPS